jgi:protein TonB
MIDQPVAPKPPKPAAETVKTTLSEPARIASMSLFELEAVREQSKSSADLLPTGEDPRKFAVTRITPQPTRLPDPPAFAKYQPAKKSRSMTAPLVAVSVLAIAGAAFGAWRHNRASAAPTTHLVAVSLPSPDATATPTPSSGTSTAAAIVKETVAKPEPGKPAVEKNPEPSADNIAEPQVAPVSAPAPAIHVAAAKAKQDTSAMEAPALNVIAGGAQLPQLAAPKPVSASLAVRKTTAVPAVATRTVAPIYPDIARRNGTSGDVKLQLTVSPAGKVVAANVISGPVLLRQSATYAAMQWQYRPATLEGRPIESTVEVTMKFEANR